MDIVQYEIEKYEKELEQIDSKCIQHMIQSLSKQSKLFDIM